MSNSTASAPDEVRDGRRGRFWMDDDILDVYAKELGVHGLAVYTVLCRRAAKNGQSHPSVRRIAEDLGISERQAKRELKKLKDLKLITVQRRDTQNMTSVYTILETPPGGSQSPTPVTVSHPKEDTVRREGVEANASSAIAQSVNPVSLEKHIVDGIYEAMREAKLRLPNEHFTYHLGRAQDVIAKDEPTDEEIEALPDAFVRAWKIWGKADAHTALMEMRRQKARPDALDTPNDEAPHPHSAEAEAARDKPRAPHWYVAFYPDLDRLLLDRWLRDGSTHTEIVGRLERGAA